MRILHVNSMLSGGGTDERSVRVAWGVMQRGHTTWMAGPDRREFSKVVRDLGIPFCPISITGWLKVPFIFGLARILRRERIQIVHARHGRDYWPTILAARLSGVRAKVVLSRHLAKSPSSWFSRRFLLQNCDAMVAVSEFTARVMREGVFEPGAENPERRFRPPMRGDFNRIRVVYGGIDTDEFRPSDASAQRAEWKLEPGHYVFGVAGSYALPRGKGQREFLEAAARIHTEVPHARFLIIGRGNLENILRADIERLGLTGKAWLPAYSHDMPKVMNALDCLVHPQVGTEALGSVVPEAHACGKPVIASDLDGIAEGFRFAGYGQLVSPGSVGELADAMKTWARRPALDMPARWELHARVAAAFSLPVAAKNLCDVYDDIMRRPG
ncbi:MAG: glycosyltransferase [Verrucomicrobiota bacterium]